MSKDKDKSDADLRIPAEEFDRMMRGALGVPAPADEKTQGKKKPRKNPRPKKK